ncbi:hypothetical protein ACLE20_15235 [Rhizobium sp. YIM 134829]|uniref:hypothetical protein n=1 Tax=Rhizobium sp. YIM 134829 TaxID=3390453 RepID=UPI00397E5139
MKRTIVATIAALAAGHVAAQTDDLHVQKRKLYALALAGPAYCPGIETKFLAKGFIEYDMNASEEEPELLQAEEQAWFKVFKSAPRAAVCESLMQNYGPGGSFEMFQFK